MSLHPFITVTELRQGLAAGEYSAVELAQFFLAQIRRQQPFSNAFITIDENGALDAARAADVQIANGQASALTGIPMAHKDVFCTNNVLTTCGSRMLQNFVAPYDATVVHNLQRAGMVCLGKTNMDEFAMGSSNENSAFGPVANPWQADRVPGGSSGGSAAAVGGGQVPVATGTDTGGSIRQPAAFCGITGLKPTYGRVSRYGMVAFASSLDQGGLFARTARDIGLVLGSMAGFDAKDSTSAQRRDHWLDNIAEHDIPQLPNKLRIGLPTEYFQTMGATPHLDEVRKLFEQLGHTCTDVALPNTQMAIPAYYVVAGAEASTNLSRYDGVRFGYRCENPQSLEDLYQRSRSEGFGEEVKRRILTGTYALSVGYFDAYYLQAQKIRRLIADDFNRAFSEVDLLLTPTAPGPAFAAGALKQDPVAMYQQDKFTVPASLAGLPALSMPCGFEGGLPLGAQLIGPAFREDLVLGLARDFQHATDWHLHTPATTVTGQSA
ncbi:MAG: Asp-tRNA(Asn)/Glu-tRNA(Gln) amidotransferase subunit GatA [bacterium]